VLQVIRFPVETLAGRAGKFAVGHWERRRRPYGLDLVTADTFGDPLSDTPVSTARLDALSDRPFLLLVHGTFSRGRSAFDALGADRELFADLLRRYDGRVLVFDHPTLHVDPTANVTWLLDRLPDRAPLTFDVICHSRGGLVARQLCAPEPAAASGRPAPRVRTLIHVATPNAGTVLAGPERWGTLLDVLTNLLSLLPDSPTGVAIEGVLEVVKQVATGMLGGLDGLASMDSDGPWLDGLDAGPPAAGQKVYGLASDFSPATGSPLAVRALDLMVDSFFSAGNDLVVPTDGVYRGRGGYRIDEHRVVPHGSAISHTSFFADPAVRRTLADWLP
jgi:hypothetical protein